MNGLELIRDLVSWALFLTGALAVITGALGLIRFPDFYTRLHAAGITDTGGAELMIFAMMLQAPNWLIVAKLFFIGVFMFFASPVSTHAISHAAWVSGQKPMIGATLARKGDR